MVTASVVKTTTLREKFPPCRQAVAFASVYESLNSNFNTKQFFSFSSSVSFITHLSTYNRICKHGQRDSLRVAAAGGGGGRLFIQALERIFAQHTDTYILHKHRHLYSAKTQTHLYIAQIKAHLYIAQTKVHLYAKHRHTNELHTRKRGPARA